MATLAKKTNKELEAQVNNQAEQISQLQDTIGGLQKKVELSEKEKAVLANLSNEKARSKSINPGNLAERLKKSDYSPELQARILKNAG